jgi:hypothetical protein
VRKRWLAALRWQARHHIFSRRHSFKVYARRRDAANVLHGFVTIRKRHTGSAPIVRVLQSTETVLQLLIALVCGGLGGAVFTWFVNRRSRLPPRLRIQLLTDKGERGVIETQEGYAEQVRYYHLHISNDRRLWSPADNVQVFLIRIEEPGPDGMFQLVWSGDVPMRWRDQEFFPLARTIGPAAHSDLCCVGEQKWLRLLPLFAPNSLETTKRGSCRIAASLQARSSRVDSPITRVDIAWDGLWDRGDSEMRRHVKISVTEGDSES